MSLTRRGKSGPPATLIRLDDHRAKYLAPSPPTDAFLADAEQTGRILTALVRLPEVRTGDLWSTLVRMRMALDMYVGGDPLADKLRQQALALEAAIWARG